MDKNFPVFLLVWLLISTLSGCSVKEDRNTCPCQVKMDMRALKEIKNLSTVLLVGYSDDKLVFSDTLNPKEIPDMYEKTFPQGEIVIGCFMPPASVTDISCMGKRKLKGLIDIKEGRECPPVFMGISLLQRTNEIINHKVELHKNYCRLTLNILNIDNFNPYIYKLTSSVNGYAWNGTPSRGTFYVNKRVLNYSKDFSVYLPRQIDNSLMLHIIDDKEEVKSFAIGEYIEARGYDWKASDLDDLELTLDFTSTDITVNVDRWSKKKYLDILM